MDHKILKPREVSWRILNLEGDEPKEEVGPKSYESQGAPFDHDEGLRELKGIASARQDFIERGGWLSRNSEVEQKLRDSGSIDEDERTVSLMVKGLGAVYVVVAKAA